MENEQKLVQAINVQMQLNGNLLIDINKSIEHLYLVKRPLILNVSPKKRIQAQICLSIEVFYCLFEFFLLQIDLFVGEFKVGDRKQTD